MTIDTTPEKSFTMSRTYNVGGKSISLDDDAAVRALNADELAELLTLTQQTPPEAGDVGPDFPVLQPPAGTGFVLLQPPAVNAVNDVDSDD